jgi:hypothetical protein
VQGAKGAAKSSPKAPFDWAVRGRFPLSQDLAVPNSPLYYEVWEKTLAGNVCASGDFFRSIYQLDGIGRTEFRAQFRRDEFGGRHGLGHGRGKRQA